EALQNNPDLFFYGQFLSLRHNNAPPMCGQSFLSLSLIEGAYHRFEPVRHFCQPKTTGSAGGSKKL
ncbi:MAG: hypothetical protein ACOYD9_06050, partial [Pyramidobacter sp.]